MIPRDVFINKLRELGYKYKGQSDKVQMWRKNGGTHSIVIRRKEDPLSETYVRSVLHQCKCSDEEIEKFIGANRCH